MDLTDATTAQPTDDPVIGRGRVAARLVVVGALATLTAILLYVGTVGTRTGQLIGELILGGRPASVEVVGNAERVLSVLSRSSLVVGTLTVCAIALLGRRPRLAAAAAATVVAANLTTQLLKLLVLDRTDLLDGLFYPLPNSFPSGHATAAASIAVAALLVLPPLLRAPAIFVSAVVVAAVGVSTLLAGWHRMADAVGGVFVATAWAALFGALLAWRRGVERVGARTASLGGVSSTLPLVVGAAILAMGAFGYLVVAIDPLDVLLMLADRGGSPALFWVGVAITIGTTLAALGALGYALRDVRLDPLRTRVSGPPPDSESETPRDLPLPPEAGAT